MSMVLSERRGSITILTLNNPEQYNALGGSLLNDLDAALETALQEPRARAIVITGAGKGFCSGAQFGGDTFAAGDSIASSMRGTLNPLVEKMRSLSIPIVVAVNGAAAGAGVGIALAGDIVIAARSARFILSFVRLLELRSMAGRPCFSRGRSASRALEPLHFSASRSQQKRRSNGA